MGNASKKIRSGLRDTEFRTYEGEQGGAGNDQHDTAGGLGRIDHQSPQIFDGDLPVYNHTNK